VAINQGLQKQSLLVKKGQAVIWAANLLHGGDPIKRAGSTRHSQVTHYYFENCTYYTPLFTDFALKEIFLRNIVDISTGKHVENKYLGEVINTNETVKKDSPGKKNFWEVLTRPFAGFSKQK
jgi:hypothetical protein